MSRPTDGSRYATGKDSQGRVVLREAFPAEPHTVDRLTISQPLYSSEDREFGRIGNPGGTIVPDATGSFTPQRVSWADGGKPSEVYVASFIPAQRWNGWAKPYFSQGECLRLALTQSAFKDSLKFEYDPVREVWQEFNDEEGYREDCPWIVIGDEVCHQVGSGFTWMELPDQPQRLDQEMPGIAAVEVRCADGAKRRSTYLPGEPVNSLAIQGALDTGYGPFL